MKKKLKNLSFHRLSLVFVFILALLLIPIAGAQADILTSQSIDLSSSAKGATDVHYSLEFTAKSDDTNAVVVNFCRTSSVITDTCDTVGGLDTTNVGTTGSDDVSQLFSQAVLIKLSATANSGDTVSVELTGITNPYDPGTFYARIATYETNTDAENYTPGEPGTYLDSGSVALSIIDGVDVGGSVLESLEFCTSGSEFDEDGCEGTLTNPDMVLGDNGALGLELATSSIYTHISTNAASGAVVSFKTSALECGGLMLNGNPGDCYIAPQTTPGTISDGTARFGLKLGTMSGGTGILLPAGSYSQTDYFMNYVAGDSSGVTSAFGDPIYTTDNTPLSNGEAELIFGANRATNTPAGDYNAKFSLLATGKF